MAKNNANQFSAYDELTNAASNFSWTFPLLLAMVVVAIVWIVLANLGLSTGPTGEALTARLTWAVAATLFATVFVFALIQCHVLMFRCGLPVDALGATIATTVLGLFATILAVWNSDIYLGPDKMQRLLNGTAFSLGQVRTLTALFDGFGFWAAFVVLATSCIILRNGNLPPGKPSEELLSRQIRASRILLSIGSALLITGVAQTSALHKWPAQEEEHLIRSCCPDVLQRGRQVFQTDVQTTAVAISSTAGTACSLVLAAAYLPLGLLLRQRAYRVVQPWERTEAWLAMHGLSLRPTQQLGKVLLMLGPFLAGGPITTLFTLLTQ